MTDQLVWPPTKEDLEKLYLEQRLSAARIAKAYGLEYASPKTAESTILHHLKKNGIQRRDRAEHVRKITEEMVDRWILRYHQGESLRQIAGSDVDPVSVWNHLRERGVRLRDKVEAQIAAVTKYQKRRFEGDVIEKAYLFGFVYGDCQTFRHGRAIRVRTSTTHKAQSELFTRLFEPYGFVQRYPAKAKLTEFEWYLQVDLDHSFDFLLKNIEDSFEEYFSSVSLFLSFLSGFFDAEGTIYFHRKGIGGAFEISISNTNGILLERIQRAFTSLGHHSKLETSEQKVDRLGYEKMGSISRLCVWRKQDVLEVLGLLKLRHREKADKAKLILETMTATTSSNDLVLQKWRELILKFRRETDSYVDEARDSYSHPDMK